MSDVTVALLMMVYYLSRPLFTVTVMTVVFDPKLNISQLFDDQKCATLR